MATLVDFGDDTDAAFARSLGLDAGGGDEDDFIVDDDDIGAGNSAFPTHDPGSAAPTATARSDPNGTRHWTDLHAAARRGDDELLRRLIHSGADIWARTPRGATACHIAAVSHRFPVSGAGGGEPLATGPATLFGGAGGAGAGGEASAGGADLSVQLGDADDGFLRCVEALLDADPSLVAARDSLGRTPLHAAALAGSIGCAGVLRERGAAVDDADDAGRTPLHLAVASGADDVVGELLRMGADVEARDSEGLCALHFAADADRIDIATLLIRRGLDPNCKSDAGHSPTAYGNAETRSALEVILAEAHPPSVARTVLSSGPLRRGVFGSLAAALCAYQLAVLPYTFVFSTRHTHLYTLCGALVLVLALLAAGRMWAASQPWTVPKHVDIRILFSLHLSAGACLAFGVWYSSRLVMDAGAGPNERHFGPLAYAGHAAYLVAVQIAVAGVAGDTRLYMPNAAAHWLAVSNSAFLFSAMEDAPRTAAVHFAALVARIALYLAPLAALNSATAVRLAGDNVSRDDEYRIAAASRRTAVRLGAAAALAIDLPVVVESLSAGTYGAGGRFAWALVFSFALMFKQLVLDPIVFLSAAPPGYGRPGGAYDEARGDAFDDSDNENLRDEIMLTTPIGGAVQRRRGSSVDIAEAYPISWDAPVDEEEEAEVVLVPQEGAQGEEGGGGGEEEEGDNHDDDGGIELI